MTTGTAKREKTEDRLQLLESAVMNANDAIIILETVPDKLPGRQILYINDAFTKMTGYTFEEATSRTLRMLRGPKTDPAKLEEINRALEQLEPVRVELINYRKDGTDFWAECNMVPFKDEKGEFTHWVSVQRDITDRKRAEEEREGLIKKVEMVNADLTKLNRELETIGAERTMSLMALTVADRIRNPASMIGARCKKIFSKEEISDSLRKSLQYIAEGAESLDEIVKEFETHLNNRKSSFKRDDLNRIVESVVSVIKKEAANKMVKLSTNVSQEPLEINMQSELLRVAVFHIMRNAIEATSEGGKIEVLTGRDGDKVILSVADTGYGISDNDLNNIFRPFFSMKKNGFGMGLPLVKQIVTEHLGELTAESSRQGGTVFKMVFPVRWSEKKIF